MGSKTCGVKGLAEREGQGPYFWANTRLVVRVDCLVCSSKLPLMLQNKGWLQENCMSGLGPGNRVLQPSCSEKMCPPHQFYKTPNPRQAEELNDE